MERLVEEKVDAFWKGLENVALKRGEVRQALFPHGIDLNGPRFRSHFRKKIKERRGLGSLHMRFVIHLLGFMYCSGLILFLNTGGCCMGTVVSVTPGLRPYLVADNFYQDYQCRNTSTKVRTRYSTPLTPRIQARLDLR